MNSNQPSTSTNTSKPDLTGVSAASRKTLDAVFRHPSAHNLAWTDVVTLVEKIGDVEPKANSDFEFRVSGSVLFMRKPHTKDLTGPDVVKLRHFLAQAGWSAGSSPTTPALVAATAANLLVVIDHHEAKIYDIAIDSDDASAHTIKPYDPHHLQHHLAHKASGENGQRTPEDIGFYQKIATALEKAASIVVVGHGTGKSNAAHHLVDYLREHHAQVAARIVRECTADLSSITERQLLQLARESKKGRGTPTE